MDTGSGPWLAVGVAAVGIRLLRWLTRRPAPTVVSEVLRPGETLVISHLPEPS
jgi:hypothetical protein